MTPTTTKWSHASIKDVCELIVDCVNKTAPTLPVPTPYKMIRTTNVRDGWVNLSEVKYVTEEVYRKWTRREVPRKGDVILTREAPLGEVGMLRSHDAVFLGQRLVMYRADPKKLDNRFLLYAFQADYLQGQIKSLGSGATVEHMRVPDCEKLVLKLPPLPIQHKIASVLSAYDDVIENNTRRIEILEEMAQAIYREWFVHFRFPGYEKVRMVESELGPIPEGWEVKPAGELLSYHIGGGWGKEEQSEQYPDAAYVIRGTDIPFARHTAIDSCPLRFHKRSNLASRRLQREDIVFEVSGGSKDQPVGRALLVGEYLLRAFDEDVMCASFCKLLRLDQHVLLSPVFYLHLLEIYGNQRIEKYQVQSTGISNLKFQFFLESDLVVVPDMEIQEAFNELVDRLFDAVGVLGARNTNLRRTRDMLLPKLISGEVDVREVDNF